MIRADPLEEMIYKVNGDLLLLVFRLRKLGNFTWHMYESDVSNSHIDVVLHLSFWQKKLCKTIVRGFTALVTNLLSN